MDIVVVGTSPEWEEVVQAPGEFVTGVSIDCLEEAADNPEVHCHDVEILEDGAEDDGNADSAESEDHGLDGGGIFSGKTERCAVLMVQLVNHLVQARGVQKPVKPIVPGIFENEEQSNLPGHLGPVREGHRGREAKVLCHWVEEPDLWQLNRKVREEDEFGALPLFGKGWHFLLSSIY